MEWRPVIRIEECKEYAPLWERRSSGSLFRILMRFLEHIESVLGFQVGITVPEQFEEKTAAELQAFAAIKKLQELGIVESCWYGTERYPDEPPSHIFRVRPTRSEGRGMGYAGTGIDMLDQTKALWPAVGEALERYMWNWYEPPTKEYIDSSYRALRKNKLDIFSLAGLTQGRREQGHAHYTLPFTDESVFRWVKGRSLIHNADIYVPLQLLTSSYVRSEIYVNKKESLLRLPVSTGAAAGQTLDHALLSGLLEVIERDAFMIYWLNKLTPEHIDMASIPDERFRAIEKRLARYHLEAHLLYVKTDVPVHTVLAVVIDRSGVGPAVMVGASAGFSIIDAAYQALNETLGLRTVVRGRWESAQQNKSDFSDMSALGHEGRLLYWCQKEKIDDISFLLRGATKRYTTFRTYDVLGTDAQLKHLLRFFKKHSYEVAYKELLSASVKKALGGMTVAMVVVPAFQPVHLYEELPCFGGTRLGAVPRFLGKKARAVPHTDPHPFP